MNTYLRHNLGRTSPALLAFWIAAAGAGASLGQSAATVSVQVSLPGRAFKTGLRVRAVPGFPGEAPEPVPLTKHDFDATDRMFNYTFYGLQPGQYAFIVCDGLEYLPVKQTQAVQPGVNHDPVSLFLKTPDAKALEDLSSPPQKGPDGQPIGRDTPVFLKDAATGCTVDSARAERGGIAKFHGVPLGNYYFDDNPNDEHP